MRAGKLSKTKQAARHAAVGYTPPTAAEWAAVIAAVESTESDLNGFGGDGDDGDDDDDDDFEAPLPPGCHGPAPLDDDDDDDEDVPPAPPAAGFAISV